MQPPPFQEEDQGGGGCRVVRGWDLPESYGRGYGEGEAHCSERGVHTSLACVGWAVEDPVVGGVFLGGAVSASV